MKDFEQTTFTTMAIMDKLSGNKVTYHLVDMSTSILLVES